MVMLLFIHYLLLLTLFVFFVGPCFVLQYFVSIQVLHNHLAGGGEGWLLCSCCVVVVVL